jgi:hypothetical protein
MGRRVIPAVFPVKEQGHAINLQNGSAAFNSFDHLGFKTTV